MIEWKRLALIALAIYSFSRGVSYFPFFSQQLDRTPQGLQLITGVLPLWVWGLVWCAVGLFIALTVIVNTRQLDGIGFSLVGAMMMTWGALYLLSFILDVTEGKFSRELITANSYFWPGLALMCLSIATDYPEESKK